MRLWRLRSRLSANDKPTTSIRHRAEASDATYARVAHAIGRRLPQDVQEDAVSNLYLAVRNGDVPEDDIEKRAWEFVKGVFATNAQKSVRSLDAIVPGTTDLRLIDTLRDESSSSWLEEMGATVW